MHPSHSIMSSSVLALLVSFLFDEYELYVVQLDNNEIGFGSTEYIVFRAKGGVSDEDFLFSVLFEASSLHLHSH